jgi:mannose-6-phosphate isomerase-like protein (cupin superfamily)
MTGLIHSKVWGTTQCLFEKNNVEIHRIEAKKGGFCSIHEHKSKHNMFFVESGILKVTIKEDEQDDHPTDSTILEAGMATSVAPGQKHVFEVIEDCIAYEIYWVELDTNDIHRYEKGGIKADAEHQR